MLEQLYNHLEMTKLNIHSLAEAYVKSTIRAAKCNIKKSTIRKNVGHKVYIYDRYGFYQKILEKSFALKLINDKNSSFKSWCALAEAKYDDIVKDIQGISVDKDLLVEASNIAINENIYRLYNLDATKHDYTKKYKSIGSAIAFLYNCVEITDYIDHFLDYYKDVANLDFRIDLYYAIELSDADEIYIKKIRLHCLSMLQSWYKETKL